MAVARNVAFPTLVVVSGPPGSGKTQLAHALAAAIGCPAICRDEIKEGMVHARGGTFQPTEGDPLTSLTFSVFFDVVRRLLEADVSVVAEAAFQDRVWQQGLQPLLPLATVKILRCAVPDEVARERKVRRMAEPTRAALVVDTREGYEPDLAAIVSFVNST